MNRTRFAAITLPLVTLFLWFGSAHAQHVWPNINWPTSIPEQQNMNPASLDTLDAHIRAGIYGYIDRMLVIRNGHLVADHTYNLDYVEISQGKRTSIGCGVDACSDKESTDPYNYLHPSTHPFYQGRSVHTLQSITKSVAATIMGIALHNGAIDSLGTPLLVFFEEYDLSNIDPQLQEATLEHLLTMRTGIEWHEQDRPPE